MKVMNNLLNLEIYYNSCELILSIKSENFLTKLIKKIKEGRSKLSEYISMGK